MKNETKNFLNIAKSICREYLIAKSIFAASYYMSVCNKYIDQIRKNILKYVQNNKLTYNVCFRIKVNKNEIKNDFAIDLNFVFVEIYSPHIKNKQTKTIGIFCNNNFSPKIKRPNIDEGYATWQKDNGDPTHPQIHMGVNDQNFEENWKNYYQGTLQHQLIHIFENHFGYKNKKLNYEWTEDQQYNKSLEHLEQEDGLDFHVQDYYSNDLEFTPYLANLIELFKLVYEKGTPKEEIINQLRKTNFMQVQDVNDLCDWFYQKIECSDSAIKWLYHVGQKDKNLFEYARKKLINSILKF